MINLDAANQLVDKRVDNLKKKGTPEYLIIAELKAMLDLALAGHSDAVIRDLTKI